MQRYKYFRSIEVFTFLKNTRASNSQVMQAGYGVKIGSFVVKKAYFIDFVFVRHFYTCIFVLK